MYSTAHFACSLVDFHSVYWKCQTRTVWINRLYLEHLAAFTGTTIQLNYQTKLLPPQLIHMKNPRALTWCIWGRRCCRCSGCSRLSPSTSRRGSSWPRTGPYTSHPSAVHTNKQQTNQIPHQHCPKIPVNQNTKMLFIL